METIKAGLGLTPSDNASTEPVSGRTGEDSAPGAPYDAGNDPSATEAAERERTTQEGDSLATGGTETGTDTQQKSMVSSVIDTVTNQFRGVGFTGSGTNSDNTDDRAVDRNPPPAPPGEREELSAEPDSSGPAIDYENTRARPATTSTSTDTGTGTGTGAVDATSTPGDAPAPPGERDDVPAVPATTEAPRDYESAPAQPATSSTDDYNTSSSTDRNETEATTVSDPAPTGEREEARAEPATDGAPVDYEETRAQPTTSSSSSGPSGDYSRDETTPSSSKDDDYSRDETAPSSSKDDETTTTTDSKSEGSGGGDRSGKPRENPSAIPTAGGIRLGEQIVPERAEADENQGEIAPATVKEAERKSGSPS